MQYRAFISYASVDRATGERFQRAVEHFKIPKPLRGTDHGLGPVPTRLGPLFRDRSDAHLGPLADVLHRALEASGALIVLCSPASARSKWVNEEIRTFKALGRADRIFPVIVDGAAKRFHPESDPDGAFPPALFEPAPGAAAAQTPLAADLRPTGDGFAAGTLKIVAALTGVPLTVLTERQFEAERRERRIARTVAIVMTGLAIAAIAAAALAWRATGVAQARLANAIEIGTSRLDEAVALRDAYGVPIRVVQQLLDGANRDYTTLIGEDDTGVPALELQRARLLVLLSDMYRLVGDTGRQRARAEEALARLRDVPVALALRRPDTWFGGLPSRREVAAERLAALETYAAALADDGLSSEALATLEEGLALAVAEGHDRFAGRFWSLIGEHRYAGDPAGAIDALDRAIVAYETAMRDEAAGPAGSRDAAAIEDELAAARTDRAEALLERERLDEAIAEQQRATAMLAQRAEAAPHDTVALRNLAQAITREADMHAALTTQAQDTLPARERAVALLERVYETDPARLDYARDLSIAIERLGDVMLEAGDLERADALFSRSTALRRARLARDDSHPEARRDLAVALERHGDVALARQQADRALRWFDEARSLRAAMEAPGAADPVLTRDLSVLWWKTAMARHAAGAGHDWGGAYEAAIARLTPLLDGDDAAPGWLRDVAVFRSSYAEALAAAGRTAESCRQRRAALDLIERQLAVTPESQRLLEDRAFLQSRPGC